MDPRFTVSVTASGAKVIVLASAGGAGAASGGGAASAPTGGVSGKKGKGGGAQTAAPVADKAAGGKGKGASAGGVPAVAVAGAGAGAGEAKGKGKGAASGGAGAGAGAGVVAGGGSGAAAGAGAGAGTVSTAGAGPASTVKRDKLHEIEKKMQGLWEEEHLFECDAPTEPDPVGAPRGKFFATFPYPYSECPGGAPMRPHHVLRAPYIPPHHHPVYRLPALLCAVGHCPQALSGGVLSTRRMLSSRILPVLLSCCACCCVVYCVLQATG